MTHQTLQPIYKIINNIYKGDTMKTISQKAKDMKEENQLDEAINQAYIDNVGEEYATADDAQEAYQGEFSSDEDFARDMAEQLGSIKDDAQWPYTCIDWEFAAKELMYDYFEVDGYYFRNL
jgi:antirestriction protein